MSGRGKLLLRRAPDQPMPTPNKLDAPAIRLVDDPQSGLKTTCPKVILQAYRETWHKLWTVGKDSARIAFTGQRHGWI